MENKVWSRRQVMKSCLQLNYSQVFQCNYLQFILKAYLGNEWYFMQVALVQTETKEEGQLQNNVE